MTITEAETNLHVNTPNQNFRLPPLNLRALAADDLARWRRVAEAKNAYWGPLWRHPNSCGWAESLRRVRMEIERRAA